MISFNEDYSAVKSQLKYIRKHLSQDLEPSEVYDYIELHRALEGSIGINKKKKYSFSSKEDEIFECEKAKVISKLETNFQEESSFHKRFLGFSYHSLSRLQEEVQENILYIDDRNYSILPEEEEKELLTAFLKEENPALKDIFDDMLYQGEIYSVNQRENPSATYNYLQAIPNIFIPKGSSTIIKLGDLVHEIGHAYDDIALHQKNKEKEFSYNYFSLYQEVFSYYYQYKFLQFLIQNDIHKTEAQNEVLNQLEVLIDDIKTIKRQFHTSNYDPYQMFLNIRYSYGPIIAHSIMDSNEQKQAFQSFQYDSFNSSKLEDLGFTHETTAKNIEQKIKTYLKL